MIRALHALMIAVLMLTGLALGAARGQVQVGAQVVLCSGDAAHIVLLGPDGKPVTQRQFCPDMALSLLASVAGAPPAAPPLRSPRHDRMTVAGRDLASRPLPAAPARGPPAGLS